MFRGSHKGHRGTLVIFDRHDANRAASWVTDDPRLGKSALVEYPDMPFAFVRDERGKYVGFEWNKREWALDIQLEITPGTKTFAQVMVTAPVDLKATVG